MIPKSIVECCDCMDFMAKFSDKYFDLAICDPPYGQFNNDKRGHLGGGRAKKYGYGKWDKSPLDDYFSELFRISKNQIIWGGNYFKLPQTRCFLVWRKITISESFSMAMCEYAWASFNDNAKWIEIASQNKQRIHPTQKPVALYIWQLQNYAKPGDKILDTHLGSQSSRIAARIMGFDFWGCEIDPDYFADGCKRFEKESAQEMLFQAPQREEANQPNLFNEEQ
jgi:site-specific DNA-methyltransferase (adenine-specific)